MKNSCKQIVNERRKNSYKLRDKNMRKCGFTLIELLGVLIILSAIVLLVFPSILNQVKKSENKIDKATQALFASAAELYLEEHGNQYGLIENDIYCISFETLIKDKKLSSAIEKPENFSASFVKATVGNNKVLSYELVESCTEINTTPDIPNDPDITPGENSKAPKIEFTGSNILVDTATTFDVMDGVIITDDNTPTSEIKVAIIGEVSLGIPGKYPIVYEAVDQDLNVTTEIRIIEIIETEYIFDYTGSYQEFVVPLDGTYEVELWGASSGGESSSSSNVSGGYTRGTIKLTKDQKFYFYIGGKGTTSASGGYNGGGTAAKNSKDKAGISGGGATDIRYFEEIPTEEDLLWDSFIGLRSRIMVAGGGSYKGASGGINGYDGNDPDYPAYTGKGATQTSGGAAPKKYAATCVAESNGTAGSFGVGGIGGASASTTRSGGGSGGGGGYYGGSGASGLCDGTFPGGGGSSFISGHAGCNAISKESTSTNIIHTGQANHYSNLIFTDTLMIDGEGYQWADVKGNSVGVPNYDGTGKISLTEVRDGYAKITYIIE